MIPDKKEDPKGYKKFLHGRQVYRNVHGFLDGGANNKMAIEFTAQKMGHSASKIRRDYWAYLEFLHNEAEEKSNKFK